MARQVGSIRLKGTIDGINYYQHKDAGDLARRAGGGFGHAASKKSGSTRPGENASEFGHCSRIKTRFRLAMAPFLSVRKDGRLHGRLMQLLMKLKMLDRVNARGERRVGRGFESPLGRQLMGTFVFTPQCSVIDVLGAAVNFDFGSRTLTVTDLDIRNVSFPSGATHLALTLGLLRFDFDTFQYQLKSSAPFYIDKSFTGTSFVMEVDLPEGSGMTMAVLGMKVYQKVEETYYLFRGANAVGVENLGIGPLSE